MARGPWVAHPWPKGSVESSGKPLIETNKQSGAAAYIYRYRNKESSPVQQLFDLGNRAGSLV